MAVSKQRVVQVFPILLVLLAVYLICIAATRNSRARQNEAVRAKEDADWRSQNDAQGALVKSLSTPKAFQARCGAASTSVRGIMAADARDLGVSRRGAVTLIYRQPLTEMHVIFTSDKDLPLLFREHLHEKVYSFGPQDGLVEMGCVKR